jgi:hypothetical protein
VVPGAESPIHDNTLILLRYLCAILPGTSSITSEILRREDVRQRSPTSGHRQLNWQGESYCKRTFSALKIAFQNRGLGRSLPVADDVVIRLAQTGDDRNDGVPARAGGPHAARPALRLVASLPGMRARIFSGLP